MSRKLASGAQQKSTTQPTNDTYRDLCQRIKSNGVIPIISNTVFYEQLFDTDGDGVLDIKPDSYGWGTEDDLADVLAEEIRFPFKGHHRLTQVALYNRIINNKDDFSSKVSYLNWLKKILLSVAEMNPDIDPATIAEQREDLEQSSFANVAVELGYPRPAKGRPDSLAQLARLPLSIYVTTSYFDFLERAILANGRTPRTQVCFWSGEPSSCVDASHLPDSNFTPTPQAPLVYHLFGLETYPESLVLTEDDYLDFLTLIVQDSTSQQNPHIPHVLRQSLTRASLVLLGYQLHAWDFRILFRGLVNTLPAFNNYPYKQKISLSIQLDPENQPWAVSPEDIKAYLKGYFEKENQMKFDVEYSTTVNFVNGLSEAWDQWRR